LHRSTQEKEIELSQNQKFSINASEFGAPLDANNFTEEEIENFLNKKKNKYQSRNERRYDDEESFDEVNSDEDSERFANQSRLDNFKSQRIAL